MVDGEDELRDHRGGHRLDEPGAGADDPGVLRLGADHEPAHVLHEEQRQSLAAGGLDEVGDLLGALGVDDAAEAGPLARAPLISPRWLAITATGHPSIWACPQIISPATSGWNSSSAPSSSRQSSTWCMS